MEIDFKGGRMKAFTESTLIPLGLVVMIVGVVWTIGNVSFQTAANAKDIELLKGRQDAVSVIQSDIAVIKSRMDSIDKRLRE